MKQPQPPSVRNPGIGIPDVLMFLLELAMWSSFFFIGWKTGDGLSRWVFSLMLGIGAILMWAVFRTPGMQANGKEPIFATPGPVRLVIEIGLFFLAGVGLWATGYRWAAETLWTFAGLIYILSFSRIRCLFAQRF